MEVLGLERRSLSVRLLACVAVGLVFSAAIAPSALAADAKRGPSPLAAAAARAPAVDPSAKFANVDLPPEKGLPELWLPREAVLVGAARGITARALFDGDTRTSLDIGSGGKQSIRIDLGAERVVTGLALAGAGRLAFAVSVEGSSGRHPLPGVGAPVLVLEPARWTQLSAASPTATRALIVDIRAGDEPVHLSELAIWALGPAREAVDQTALADRLVLGTPANAVTAAATPNEATVAAAATGGAATVDFSVNIDRDPALLGRTFLVYELDNLAHWTGAQRSINGHRLQGGYRAVTRGLGGVQVEEIPSAALRDGANTVSFLASTGRGGPPYRVRRLRIVGMPQGTESLASGENTTLLTDGSSDSGLTDTELRRVAVPSSRDAEPAHFAFLIDRPGEGALVLSARDRATRRRGEMRIDLGGRSAGWHSVSVAGRLPPAERVDVALRGVREGGARVAEARVFSLPKLASGALAIAYPLHGECFDHQVYLRGFLRGAGDGGLATLEVNGEPREPAPDLDGSFSALVAEPAAARGKPWTLNVQVRTADGDRHARAVSIDPCTGEPPPVASRGAPIEDLGAPYGAVVSPHRAQTLSFGGAMLEVPAGAVDRNVRVTVRPLGNEKLPPLGRLMTNVTPAGGLYRFGPHGLVFKKPVKLSLPIDSARIPEGMSTRDVQTFYYDGAHGRWMSLGRLAAGRERVLAMTGHFTDFINATLASPDHPEAQLFNPNTIKGMKLGDPGAAIALIDPPQADPSGAARLRYPIETPPGRNGIQPDLALTYDSERVNTDGWLGLGWELSLSSIEIDTRFGVPRYDGSETYLLDGAMLVQNADGTFQRRVEGRFDHIVRIGSGATDYHWEVTDKAGTVSTYGASAGRLSDARTSPGNIFRWYLESVRDTFGNTMTVSYISDPFTNGDQFNQVYPKQIDYTANGALAAAYHVEFVLDDGGTRPDVVITGRPGFPVATRRRLVEIRVSVGPTPTIPATPIRAYEFEYNPNLDETFDKTVLSAISLRSDGNNPATELYRHTFDYFKAPPVDGMFGSETDWGDFSQGDGSPRTDDGLSHAQDVLYGASGSVGFGLGDLFSATVSAGGDSGDTTPNLLLIDANGDGMPDQLESGGHASLNSILAAAPQRLGSGGFPGLGGIGHTNRSGWTVGGSINALEGVFGVGGSYSQHSAEDDALVTDMDGDGLPDVVSLQDGVVFVNANTGQQSFGRALQWGGFSLGGVSFTRQDRFDQAKQAGAFFPTDPLIRWVAPFGGTIRIDATLAKKKAGGDGVDAQLFVNAEGTARWTCSFDGNDASTPCNQSVTTTIAAGDRVYLKIDPRSDPRADELASSVSIGYQVDSSVAGQLEAYGAPIYTFNQESDFSLAGKPYLTWTASANGQAQINGCFAKDSTPDDITVSVTQDGPSGHQVFKFDATADQTGTFCIPGLDQPISVSVDDGSHAQDTLTFRVDSETQINPATVRWPASVSYQTYCRRDPQGGPEVCGAPVCVAQLCTIGPGDPLADFPFPQGLATARADVFYPAFEWTSATPAATRTFVVGSGGTPEIKWNVSSGAVVGGNFVPGPRMIVFVQGVNRLISKAHLDNGNRSTAIDTSPSVRAGEQLFFTVFFPDGAPRAGQPFSIGTPTVDGTAAAVNVRFPDPQLDNNGATLVDAMSGGYHRWFYGDWNGALAFDESRITPSGNPQTSDAFVPATPAPFGLPTRADLGVQALWLGRGAGELMAAGTINPGFTTSGAGTGQADAVSALRVADTWNVDLSATVAVINANLNAGDSTTDIDLLDVNGDRLPDSVTQDQVQFNQGLDPVAGQGAFGDRVSVPMGFGDLRETTNGSFRIGFSAAGVGHMINLANAKSKTAKQVDTDVASASTDYGISSTRIDFVDINGDGLVDHVRRTPDDGDGVHVALNLGYGFSKEILWPSGGWQRSEIAPRISTPANTSFGNDLGSDVVSGALDALDVIPDGTSGHPAIRIKSTNALRIADSQTNNLSVGTPGESFGAGGGPNASLTRKLVDFVDLNGDGLPDQVLRNPGENSSDGKITFFHVKLNRGDHFAPETVWSVPNWETDVSLPSLDFLPHPDGIGYSTMAGWGMSIHFQVCFIVCVGGAAFYSRDNGGANVDFEDIDGDGKPDHVLKRVHDSKVHVKLNQTGKANLLRVVHRPLGGTITIDYQRLGNRVDHAATPAVDMPSNQWALSSVKVESGQLASQPQPLLEAVDYTAAGTLDSVIGFYDRSERESYGYANVKTSFVNEGTSIARQYLNHDYYQKGLPVSVAWNQVDSPTPAQTLKRETYSYADPSGKDPTAQPVRAGTYFPAPRTTDTFWPEGDTGGGSKHRSETKGYDTSGNLTDLLDVGDVDFGDPSDDFNYHLDYVHPDAAGLVTKPSAITARTGQDQAGALLRQRTASYFPSGRPRAVTDTIVGGKDPTTGAPRTETGPALATWTFGYDGFGNVASAIGPEGHAFVYGYDPDTQTYRTGTTDNSFHYSSAADYDFRFGVPKALQDVDGARQDTVYDDFGRMVQVFGPKDFDSNGVRTTASLTFAYSEQPHAAAGFIESLPASATTSHKNAVPSEMSRPGDPIATRPAIRTVAFVDGLGRTIQTKKDVTRDDGLGNVADGMTVSGVVIFDSRGRVYQQGQPVFRAAGADFVPDVPTLNPTTFAYDVLSRERQVTRPDASSVDAGAHGNLAVTTTSYQLGTLDGKLYLLQLVQDARGEVRSTYRSVREEIVAVDEVNKIGGTDNVHLTTRYGYDPLSQLVTVTDAKENVTTAAYDTVGKTVTLTSPDAGRTEWRYDRAGNATVKETANARAASQLIRYVYNADRLEQILYPTSAPATYSYGDPTEIGPSHGFVAGRVKRRVDESGEIDFLYDGLGDVVQETTTLVNERQSQKPYVNTMTYSYDSFGRIIEMQFPGPGAEIVRYGYDGGGEVTSARGLNTVSKPNKPPLDTVYLQHIGYDEFGQRTRLLYGNGIPTSYAYEPDTRRLSQVNTDYRDPVQIAQHIGPLPMQRMRYAYDLVGNVRSLANAVPSEKNDASVVVGPTSFTFDYDRLYQLTHVDGTYQDHLATRLRHSLDVAYDGIGNMTSKNQQDFQDTGGVNGTFQPGPARPQTTYALGYQYAGPAPHAVSHIDERLQGNVSTPRAVSHDGDGNQTGWTFDNGTSRAQTWNEEDRLREVKDQGHVVGRYLYNAEGVRTHSFVDGNETIYPSQYLSIRNGMFFTQHIYAGQTRIASKVNADSLNNPDTLWYHPDHIQSTQFVSAADQTLVQHFEYFASGETWKEESTDAVEPFRPAYAFNGKELDTKTGYYYFGARYYDPQVQNWQSTEPLLVKFVRGTPNDGLYKPANLAVYTYSGNNPVLFVDPNGETEVAFHMRSFAPFKSFGGGFNGDNRSFTTSTASSVTSRVRSRFEFDTSTGQLGGLSTVSDPSHFLGHFAKTAKPTGEAHVAASDLDTSTFELGANHAGSNPLVPGAPDIDLGADIKLHESKGALTITSLLHGNNFPNSELFVEDTAGNKVFLNAFETSAGRNTGPFFHLFGAGKERLGGQREIQIQLDDSGHFTGIIDKGKVIPLSEYNRLFKASHED